MFAARRALTIAAPAALGLAYALNDGNEQPARCLSAPPAKFQQIPISPKFATNHAIYENVLRPDALNEYSVFANSEGVADHSQPVVVANIRFGTKVNGHKGIVHGGVASLLFDDAFGFAYFLASGMLLGFTANLSVNYRAPLPEGTDAVMRIYVQGVEGRKVKLVGKLESEDGSKLYSEASALYIIDRSMKKMDVGDVFAKKK